MPRVSVIIPLYNKGPHIKRAITSIQNQSINDIEIVVIDDGSTDDGLDIVKNIDDDRISLFSQSNEGVSTARNNGVKKSKSNFITFLDADDEWTINHLETLLRLKKNFPLAGAYSTAYVQKDRDKIVKKKYKFILPAPWEGIIDNYFKSALFGTHPMVTGMVGIPKKIFQDVGGFDEKANQGEDLDLWAKIALKYPVAFSWDIGGIYHLDAVNRICKTIKPINYHPLIVNGKKAIRNNVIPFQFLPDFKEYIAKKEIEVVEKNILAGNMITARKMIDQVETKIFYFDKFKCQMYSQLPNCIYKFIYRWKFILRPLSILYSK